MTLRELRAAHPERFHPNQDWFAGHEFMSHTGCPEDEDRGIAVADTTDPNRASLCATTLARRYIATPADPVWRRYLWTSDFDDLGQRVYVGDNGRGLEIHRHIHLTDRFGVPAWR